MKKQLKIGWEKKQKDKNHQKVIGYFTLMQLVMFIKILNLEVKEVETYLVLGDSDCGDFGNHEIWIEILVGR